MDETTGSLQQQQQVDQQQQIDQQQLSQNERRKIIREIMQDTSLSQVEKNKQIQALMDGRRRRSSCGSGAGNSICSSEGDEVTPETYASSMAAIAAHAADYYSSDDDDGDAMMSDAGSCIDSDGSFSSDYRRGAYQHNDARSVASTISAYSAASYGVGGQQYGQQEQCTMLPQHEIPQGQSYRQAHGRSQSLQDFTDNDRVAAAANSSFLFNNPAHISRLMEQSRPPCTHYDRNCTLISPCCGLAFGCRICHDECPVLPKPLALRNRQDDSRMMMDGTSGDGCIAVSPQKGSLKQERRLSMPLALEEEEENHHAIDRFAVREVICRECYTRQPSKTNNCIECGVRFGAYHCSICNLWMSDTESPYHCEDCGFCRVGGRENFKHCHDCGMCIDALLFDDHNCKAGKYMSNCPICQEDLFSSRYASHEMPCGHAIHWHCFKELTSYDTRCPVCKKTAETPEHMATTWSAIAMGIALQPVPPEMARVVDIFCNDCEEISENQRWHFLGVRCACCLSFNTNVERIVMQGREAAELLDRLELEAASQATIPTNISMPINFSSSDTNNVARAPQRTSQRERVGADDFDDDTMMEDDAPPGYMSSSNSTDGFW